MIRLRRQEKYSVKLFDLIRKADTDKDAAFELGMLYLNGNNICQDTQRALFYFQQASELGHLGVEVIYAYLYKCGAPNFEPNLIKAAESFEFAGLYIRVDALYFLLSYNLYFIFILLTISVLSIVYVDYFPYLYKIL